MLLNLGTKSKRDAVANLNLRYLPVACGLDDGGWPTACKNAVIFLPTVCKLHSTKCRQVWLIDPRHQASNSAICRALPVPVDRTSRALGLLLLSSFTRRMHSTGGAERV